MCVDVPVAAARSILAQQKDWAHHCEQRTGEEFKRKRSLLKIIALPVHYGSNRSMQKIRKTARHEREKAVMENLKSVGITTGEYLGRGQGRYLN